jgi:hypothetical protein
VERVRTQREREAIGAVLLSLPEPVRARLEGVHFVSEVPPRMLGLHSFHAASFGRSYDTTSHAVWECHQIDTLAPADRRSTVVLLDGDVFDPLVVLHELGHALDERLGFPSDRLAMKPLDSYAATHRTEAFATAFQSWAVPAGPDKKFFHTRDVLRAHDPATAAFFDGLAIP